MLRNLAALTLIGAAIHSAGVGAENRIFESTVAVVPRGRIDTLVFDNLKRLAIPPARLSSDAVFLRRVYLDAIGTLPAAQEAAAFLQDPDPRKRSALIDRLLERDEFATYWAMKWSDLLRVKAEFPINLWPNAAQAYHHWILASLGENKPYDRFARELLTESGSNFRSPPVNFYRALQSREPPAIAQAVALTLMGERAGKWPKERLAGMAAFFSRIGYKQTGEWKEEIVFFDPSKKPSSAPVYPDGTPASLAADRDPREAFADWLISPRNPWFARNIVNRVWSWLLGRGIVHEPDDMRPDNPAENPELLAYLEKELITHRYDLKHIYRLILNSQVYQLSSIPRINGTDSSLHFAAYPLRRLEAEVLIDALCQITGTTEQYSSQIPEPYTYIPEGRRSIGLPDGSITSPFLELFGRPPRDTGLEAERSSRPSDAQRLHMLNSTQVARKIDNSPALRGPGARPATLYLTILSRFPTAGELKAVEAYAKTPGIRPRDILVDLAWALINSSEFLYRH